MSFNPAAKEFVPRFGATPFVPAAAAAASPVAQPNPVPSDEVENKAPEAAAPAPASTTEPEAPAAKPEPVEDKVEQVTKAVDKVTVSPPQPKKKKETVTYEAHDKREHLNIVFIGHVDAGKSTISGNLLFLTGQVDQRTIAKYEREAKEKNRESWYFAYVMDTNEEERSKGKTVEVGRAQFATDAKRYTILDAPGHKKFVPNMITGTAQADVGVLVISARKGEFETGFDRGGQTREHAMLAKTLGVERLIVLINKMDDSTVEWSKERYDECVNKLSPFLKGRGFSSGAVWFLPCSGITGANLLETVSKEVCPWFEGESLVKTLDSLEPMPRDANGPLRIPVIDRYKEMGLLHVIGKVEVGTLVKGSTVAVVPTAYTANVVGILVDEDEIECALPGENVIVKLKGVDEDDVHGGMVLSCIDEKCPSTKVFKAKMVVSQLLEHKPILSAGYQCVLHLHSLICECEIIELLQEFSKKNKPLKRPPRFVRNGTIVTCKIAVDLAVPIESYQDRPQLGRFTLRDEGKTIAIGKVMELLEE